MTVVRFPYSASRRLYSRRPRVSKNGTPEERAAKVAAIAAKSTTATVTEISSRSDDKQHSAKAGAAKPGSMTEFTRSLRYYFEQEFARGRTLDQIFDDLEETYQRVEDLGVRS